MAEGEIVADGPTAEVVVASPAFAPQVAKILAPLRVPHRRPGRGRARLGRRHDEPRLGAGPAREPRPGRRSDSARAPCVGRRDGGVRRRRRVPLAVRRRAGQVRQPSYAPPLMFGVLLVLVLAVVFAEIADGGIDAKALAMLGVLSAVNAALRPLGAGTAGIETVFFLLVLAGRVFGPGFGFALGCTSLFASALLTGGVGPWMPYQMFGCAWVGLFAGLLPRVRGRAEIVHARRVRRGRRLLLRLPAQPVVLAVLPRPEQLDRLPARACRSPSSGTATSSSTRRRRSAGTPAARSPTFVGDPARRPGRRSPRSAGPPAARAFEAPVRFEPSDATGPAGPTGGAAGPAERVRD